MEQLTSDIHSQIQVISRRTEPFSPSNNIPSSTSRTDYLGPPIPFPNLTQNPPPKSHGVRVSALAESANCSSTPSLISAVPQTPQSSPSGVRQSTTPSPTRLGDRAMSDALIPIAIEKMHKVYYVLPLTAASPNEPAIRTHHDPILPPPTAFSDASFPKFTSRDCTWQYILEKVVNPMSLWETYAPQSLGFYSDIKMLWQWWDEGGFVEGVGRLPALRLIEARWGTLKNQATNKGKFPMWRPRNNALVSKASILLIVDHSDCLTFQRRGKCGQTFISSSNKLKAFNPQAVALMVL